MRSFIAIDFSNALKSQISDLQKKLRSCTSSGRWKYVDNFHLTLKFLDEIDFKTAGKISDELGKISGGTDSFKLRISDMGMFQGRGCIRVLWLGVGGELEKLHRLQAEIDSKLESLGVEREKRGFTPHVTIGQDIVFSEEFRIIKSTVDFSILPEIIVDRIYLFKSEQIENKRVYTPVKEFAFHTGK